MPSLLDRVKSALPRPPATPAKGGGPVLAEFPVEHVYTFSALINTLSKAYRHTFDEAIRDCRQNALAMRRDAFIWGCLDERYRAVQTLPWHVEAEDGDDEEAQAQATALTEVLRRTPMLSRMIRALDEAVWYGRYGVQIQAGPVDVLGASMTGVTRWLPVNGDKIQYHWDGTPLVWVAAAAAERLRAAGASVVHTDRAPALVLDGEYRERFVVNQADLDDADYFDAEMAGGVHGVGARSRIYWAWHLRDEMLGWACNFLQKVGSIGLLVFPYDEGNSDSKSAAEANAKAAGKRTALTVPVPPGGDPRRLAPFTVSASMSGVDALHGLIADYFERHIERYLVGQTLSSKTEGSGLGGTGVASFHRDTKYQKIKGDAEALSECVTADLLGSLGRWNYGDQARPCRFAIDVPDPETWTKFDAAGRLISWGVPIRTNDVRGLAGFTKPGEGDDVVGDQPPTDRGGRPADPGKAHDRANE